MASTASHRARVTYGKSARKQARNHELNSPNFTSSSPSIPTTQPNGMRPGDTGPSPSSTSCSNSPAVGQDEQSAGGNGSERRAIRQCGRNQPPSLKSSTPITNSSSGSRYANVYDVPSSGDEQNFVYESRRKRRKTGMVRATSPSIPVSLALPQQQPVPGKPISTEQGLQNNMATSNEGVNMTAESRPSERLRSSKRYHHIARKYREEIPCETTTQPDSQPSRNLTLYNAGQRSEQPVLIKKRSIQRLSQAGNSEMELMRKITDDGPLIASPGRRRLVDGLNISGSDVNEPLTSVIAHSQDSGPLSPSHSESSLALPNSKDNEPSEDSTSDGNIIRRSVSTQDSHATGPRITYARQRSFLSETSMLQDPEPVRVSDQLVSPQPYGFRENDEISSLIPKTSPVGIDDESGITSSGAVRSIHELRQAGGNARFQGMVDSMLEDIEDNQVSGSRRRSGLIQLCSKLGDHEFARQFLEIGAERRFSRSLKYQVDIISSYLAVYACALLLSTGPISNATLSACCSVISDITPSLLGEEEDIKDLTKSRRMNPSRAEQASLLDLREQLSKSRIWPDKSPTLVSPQVMTLRCLEMAVRKTREKGEHLEIISGSSLDQLVGILLHHSNNLKATHALGNDFLILELVFSILESYTVEMGCLSPDRDMTIKQLSLVGPFLSFLTEQDNIQSQRLQILNIRLILNVTNNNLPLCEDFATFEIIGALVEIILSKFGLVSEDFMGEKREPVLDIVILALGTLINLTEWSETPRTLILRCKKDSVTFIDSLLRLFSNGLDTISEV